MVSREKRKIERFRLDAGISGKLEKLSSENPNLNKTLIVHIALDHLLNQHSEPEIREIVGAYFIKRKQ